MLREVGRNRAGIYSRIGTKPSSSPDEFGDDHIPGKAPTVLDRHTIKNLGSEGLSTLGLSIEWRSMFKWLGTENLSTFSGFIAGVISAFCVFVTGGVDDPRLGSPYKASCFITFHY